MSTEITRANVVVVWFVFLLLIVAMVAMFGVRITTGTALLLSALSLVPPGIMLMLWPGPQPRTAGEVIRGDHRG